MKFKTRFDRHPQNPTDNFGDFEPIYQYEYNKKGEKKLVQVGETNAYEKIQEAHESTKIENIIRRAQNGDEGILNMVNGQYLDITDMPSSLMEAQNTIIRMKEQFEHLPMDTRRKFDNDPMKYCATYGTTEWINSMGLNYVEQKEEPKKKTKKEVIENVEETA